MANSNKAIQEMINSLVVHHSVCGERFFAGYTDREEEGEYVDINTGEKMSFDNWIPGQPNNWGGKSRFWIPLVDFAIPSHHQTKAIEVNRLLTVEGSSYTGG